MGIEEDSFANGCYRFYGVSNRKDKKFENEFRFLRFDEYLVSDSLIIIAVSSDRETILRLQETFLFSDILN